MVLLFDSRWCGQHGIGRFATEVLRRLNNSDCIDLRVKPTSPFDPLVLSFYLFFKSYDFFISPGYNAPFFSRKPFALTVHDLNHIDVSDNSSFLKRLYYEFVLKRACRKSLFVFTVSEFSKNRIAEWSGISREKIFVVGNGVSSSFTPDGDVYALDGRYVLCVSNRKGHKNEVGVIESFALAKLPDDVMLVFTGAANEYLDKVIEKFNLSGKVLFVGKVSEDELASLYRGAICLLFPSFYEGFGLPALEAMACGTPVITSNVTSLPEVVGDSGILVTPNNSQEIADALALITNSETLRSELILKGLKRSSEFSWERVFSKILTKLNAVRC